jgi:hypothetical protein
MYHTRYCRDDQSWTIRWVGYVAHMQEMRNTYNFDEKYIQLLTGISECKRPLERPWDKCQNNITLHAKYSG